jgi:CubicO group peptidase (beta-lactamase class C family)
MKSKSKISQLLLSTLVITGVSVASTQLSSCKSDDNIDNNFPELTAMVQEKINQVIDEEEYATTCYGFPSAQICVTQNDKVIYNKAFGKALRYSQGDNNLNGLGTELPEDQQVVATTSTMYDLASNTKMYSVMMAIQHLLYTGEIGSVNDTIQKYIPEFSGQRSVNQQSFYLQNLTLKNILTHTSGFKASPTEFLTDQDAQNEPNLLQVRDKSQIIPNVMLLPFDSYPGTRQMYSDIDFVMAGLVIERVTGVSLDTYVENYIYKPLGLRRTMYTPLKKGFTKNYCAATELVGNTREHYVDPVGS